MAAPNRCYKNPITVPDHNHTVSILFWPSVCCVVSCVRIFSTLATAGVYFLLEIERIYLSPFGDIVSTYSFRTRSYERIKQYCVFF